MKHIEAYKGEIWMKTPFTGGCMCRTIRYKCSAEPIFMGNCHCCDCQQATGSAFAPAILVPRSAVEITGEVKYYDVVGSSGHIISRGFCPNCGSRLFGKPAIPELMGIMAGSLDAPSEFQPEMDFYVASAQPWDFMNPELPKFAKSLRIVD
jgi:hypothetical protein